MRRHQDEPPDPLVSPFAGIDRRDGSAVAVPEKDPALEADRIEHGRHAFPSLAAHVIERTRQFDRIGPAVASPRIDEHPMAGRRRKALRKVAPQRNAAEPLMQHDDRRRLIRRRPIGDRLQGICRRTGFRQARPQSIETRSWRDSQLAASAAVCGSGCASAAARVSSLPRPDSLRRDRTFYGP